MATPPLPLGSRHELLDRLIVIVHIAHRAGTILHVERECDGLLAAFPDCGMSREEVRDLLAERAAAAGVAVEFG